MAEYKDNHYVPVWLLKNFRNSAEEFYYFNKNKPEKSIALRNPESVFYAKNYYVERDENGQRDVSLERDFYSWLDNDAKLIADKIVHAARNSKVPNLSMREKETWDLFFFHQWQRTPDSHKKLLKEYDYNEEIDKLIAEFCTWVRPLTEHEKVKLSDPKVRKRIYENGRIGSLKAPPGETVKVLGTRGLGVVRLVDQNKSFIIGSLPVVKLNYPGRTHLGDPTVEVWMPLAHDVVLTPWGVRGQETFNHVAGEKIRAINQMIYQQSTEVGARSNRLLSSLANPR
jgi:Protein of unknown function (DUF4238)